MGHGVGCSVRSSSRPAPAGKIAQRTRRRLTAHSAGICLGPDPAVAPDMSPSGGAVERRYNIGLCWPNPNGLSSKF